MRKLIYGVLFLALVGIVACNKGETASRQIDPNLESYLKTAGEEHNKGLDYVFEKLKASKQSKSWDTDSSEKDILGLANEYTHDFIDKNRVEFLVNNNFIANSKVDVSFTWVIQSRQNFRQRKSAKFNNIYPKEVEDSLSVKQLFFLNILNEAMDDDSLDLEATLSVFEDVRVRAKNELQEDFYVILAAVEIGTNSLKYWHDNFDKWNSLAGKYQRKTTAFSWKQVGKVDVAVGVGAAVATGIAALFGPISWGVIGAAVVGGAVGGSVTDIIIQLW